jgi:hypothetical protein
MRKTTTMDVNATHLKLRDFLLIVEGFRGQRCL